MQLTTHSGMQGKQIARDGGKGLLKGGIDSIVHLLGAPEADADHGKGEKRAQHTRYFAARDGIAGTGLVVATPREEVQE